MITSSNFGHPIEHSVPMVAHLKEKTAYVAGANYVEQVFELTIREQYNIPWKLLVKIKKQHADSCKKEYKKRLYKMNHGSRKSHKHC